MTSPLPMRSTLARRPVAPLALASLLLAGCGHAIQGYVLRGDMSGVDWIDPGALPDGEPVQGATVLIERDPQRMTREVAGTTTSGASGAFTLPVSGFGAGWMEEVWRIRASRAGVGSADWFGSLPSGNKVLVIFLSPSGGGTDELWQGNFRYDDTGESLLHEVESYR